MVERNSSGNQDTYFSAPECIQSHYAQSVFRSAYARITTVSTSLLHLNIQAHVYSYVLTVKQRKCLLFHFHEPADTDCVLNQYRRTQRGRPTTKNHVLVRLPVCFQFFMVINSSSLNSSFMSKKNPQYIKNRRPHFVSAFLHTLHCKKSRYLVS
jgi:hypothetical protein